jgi:hypothetical protein
MTFRERVIQKQKQDSEINILCTAAFEAIKNASLFSDEWLEYGSTGNIDSWRSFKLDEYEFSGNTFGAQTFRLNGRSYVGNNEYDYKDITLSYEDMDNLEAFIKRRKKEALEIVQKLREDERRSIRVEKIEHETRELEQYKKLKEKYGNK